ncbi:response regulator transcription factor [Clostridium sp. YIM B02551]|uniref:response regulator transcription factor n=1 Tax=Clostridium sp. YIM B02551 TaxID=2910679 RepID=UPI001EEA0AB4|nr:response regulator transcription factor [Clostridium sp. YIM B02551]
MIKVLVVDDQGLMRDGLATILSTDKDIDVVACGKSGEEALELVEKFSPNIILMDVRMEGIGGVEATRLIKKKYDKVKVIILTTFDDEEYILKGLSYGASGYVFKDIESKKLIQVIKDCYNGELIMESKVAKVLADKAISTISQGMEKKEDKLHMLSEREKEIARLIGEGFTNKQIACALFISDGTVKNYVSSIYAKTGIDDRTNLALFINDK